MRRRRKKRYAPPLRQFAWLAVAALAVPVSVNWLRYHGNELEAAGERAAMIAAAVNMPAQGLDYLRERFRDELYLPQDSAGLPGEAEEEDLHRPRYYPAEEAGERDREQDMHPGPEESGSSPAAPLIPSEYRGRIISENFAATESSSLVSWGGGYIKNETRLSNENVSDILDTPIRLGFTSTDEPQVLIVHTHATEAFERYDSEYYDTRNTWRSVDNNMNIVSAGAAMAAVLERNGIGVLHDTTQHDYPSYNGSYERSARTIQDYLEEYPSIRVVLDLHRDAMERDDGNIVKPVTLINGKKAAQIMIIAACDDDGSLGVPEFRQNLRFAATFQSYLAGDWPQLTRPVYFCYRKYNQHLTPGSLLLEFGSNANTLEEAVYAAELAGQALADLIRDYSDL